MKRNRLKITMESRIHGDVYVRFGGERLETYRPKGRQGALRLACGEYLYLMDILNYLQKKSTIPLSSNKVNYFGRLLQKAGIPSKHTNSGRLYKVVKL